MKEVKTIEEAISFLENNKALEIVDIKNDDWLIIDADIDDSYPEFIKDDSDLIEYANYLIRDINANN